MRVPVKHFVNRLITNSFDIKCYPEKPLSYWNRHLKNSEFCDTKGWKVVKSTPIISSLQLKLYSKGHRNDEQ